MWWVTDDGPDSTVPYVYIAGRRRRLDHELFSPVNCRYRVIHWCVVATLMRSGPCMPPVTHLYRLAWSMVMIQMARSEGEAHAWSRFYCPLLRAGIAYLVIVLCLTHLLIVSAIYWNCQHLIYLGVKCDKIKFKCKMYNPLIEWGLSCCHTRGP